jgi:hypothetical protein
MPGPANNIYTHGFNCALCPVVSGTACIYQSVEDGSGDRCACDFLGNASNALSPHFDPSAVAKITYSAITNSEGPPGYCRISTAVSPERPDWPPSCIIDCTTYGYPTPGGGP